MDGVHELIECAVERVVEDVGRIFYTDGETMTGKFVLEFNGVVGVVGIRYVVRDVGDENGNVAIIVINEVDEGRQKELCEVDGLVVGKHGRLYLVFVFRLVVIERGDAETSGGRAVEREFFLGDTSEVDVFDAVELAPDLQSEVGRPVGDIECLGTKTAMNGELQETARLTDARFQCGRVNGDPLQRKLCDGDVTIGETNDTWSVLAVEQRKTFRVTMRCDVGQQAKCELLEGVARNGERWSGSEKERLDEG